MPPPPVLGATEEPTDTPPATLEPSVTPEPTATDTPTAPPTVLPALPQEPPAEPPQGETPGGGLSGFPGTVLDWFNSQPESTRIALPLGLVLMVYVVLYAFGSLGVGRYGTGFVIETCPVCQKGELSVVNRTRRTLGIPRVRRTVHCDYCGSVLRQVGRTSWRYTVDGDENPELFKRYNGREITDAELVTLGRPTRMQMVTPEPDEPPEYLDES